MQGSASLCVVWGFARWGFSRGRDQLAGALGVLVVGVRVLFENCIVDASINATSRTFVCG